MDPGGLFCNIKECRKPISGRAWATVCSHVVCHSCGSKTLDKIPPSCPVCDTLLKKQFEVLNLDLDPSDELKSMILAGLRPETILEIAHRGMSFWTYQNCMNRLFDEATIQARIEKNEIIKKNYQDLDQREWDLKSKLENQMQNINKLKKQVNDLNEILAETESQHEKLQATNEDYRRKLVHIVAGKRSSDLNATFDYGTFRK